MPTNELAPGTRIYVVLAPTGTNGFWEVARAGLQPLAPNSDEVQIVGRSRESWRSVQGSVTVNYGIEKYFVAEGTGNPRGKLTVAAAISSTGQASIKDLLVDGKPYAEAMKNFTP